MPLPDIIESARDYLYSDIDEMQRASVPSATQTHILRLRDIYNFWLQHPRIKDKEILLKLQHDYKLAKSQAYTDLGILKILLGEFQKTTKDYHRYRFIEMINEAYEVARLNKDAKAMAAVADKYGKYTQLDKEDIIDRDYDKIIVQTFVPTDDPTEQGFKPIPNIREKIKQKIEFYSRDCEDIEAIELDEEDYNVDEIFKQNGAEENIPK